MPGIIDIPFYPEDEVSTPTSLLPVQYGSDSVLDVSSHVVRVTPFRRNIFVTRHQAHAGDFEEHKWLLQYASSELWYEKPSRTYLRSIRSLERNPFGPDELASLINARPVSLETPRVWASAALVTPTDDDIYECTAEHPIDNDYTGSCTQCTCEKSEALDNTPLVYCLILTTCQASDPFVHGAHFNGRQIYKLVKCGSREAAVAEAFYAAGVNGWNIAFSCVMKLGHDFDEAPINAKVERAEHLWQLADEGEDEDAAKVKVFY